MMSRKESISFGRSDAMALLCVDDGTPYVVGAHAVVEILFAIGERGLSEAEFAEYIAVSKKINAARARVEAMTDEEIHSLEY